MTGTVAILQSLAPNKGAKKRRMRVGRGIGSGKGKTCGRGGKGQTARSGVAIKGFEGGQTPIHRRLPKRGFNNPMAAKVQTVNIWEIENAIESGKLKAGEINNETLKTAGILRGQFDKVKLLAQGDVKSKLSITVDAASESAVKAVEKNGGKVSISGEFQDKKERSEAKTAKNTAARKAAQKKK
ncbi:MAG TPA: 50S ribosomal protein L15 [Alphaproteobacteria bacterium]|nr:50S ribosomal protein L15 [Alphaproteobacteria bacterium]